MLLNSIAKAAGIAGLSLGLGLVAITTGTSAETTASAATGSISLKEAKSILKRSGYRSELSYAKLKVRTRSKTILYTYPGAHGMDKFSLHPYGAKHVKIYAIFGTLDGGGFSRINYIHLPKYKVVRR